MLMNRISIFLAAIACMFSAAATDYTGTMTVTTSINEITQEGAVISMNQNADGTYNAAMNLSFSYMGYDIDLDEMTFDNMLGVTGNDGYTTVSGIKQVSLLDMSGLESMIPDMLKPYIGNSLNKTVPVNFVARFNGIDMIATINFELNLSISIPMLGSFDIINTSVMCNFEGKAPNEPVEHITGDVDGNGHVDVDDMNILINIMLGNDTADKYDGRAYVTDDTNVDIDDLNAVINIMLQ